MQRTKLDNGLTVLVHESHAAPVVSVQAWVKVGSADESEVDAGLAHVHEHMLFKGTARRKVGEIAQAIEGAGGEINAWTSFDETVYYITIEKQELPLAIDILADVMERSAFDAEELSRELEVVLEELRRSQDSPYHVMIEALFKTAFEGHNYSRPIIGYEDTVRAFSREQILAFYHRWYRPENMVLVIAGDVDPKEAVAEAKARFFKDGGPRGLPARAHGQRAPQEGLRVVYQAKDVEETQLAFAFPTQPKSHEDTAALSLLSLILGAGEGSRLYRSVKREQQLVVDCDASNYAPAGPGILTVIAQVQDQDLEEAFVALLVEVLRVAEEGVSEAELDKAKTIIEAGGIFRRETAQGMARRLGYYELLTGRAEDAELYDARLLAQTAADVQRVARKYLDVSQLTVSSLTPLAQEGALSMAVVERLIGEAERRLRRLKRARPPQPGPLGATEVKLDCGLSLIVQPDPSVPVVSLHASAQGGLLFEGAEDNGVGALTAELLTRGAGPHSAEAMIERVDGMAASLGGQSGRSSIGLRASFMRRHWERALDLYAACLLEPRFEASELELEKRSQLETIASRQDSPGAIASKNLLRALYGDHPYGMTAIGEVESVSAIDTAAVRQTYARHLALDRLSLSVVGDVTVEEAIRGIEARLGGTRAAPARPELPIPVQPLSGKQRVEAHKDKEQVHLMIGFIGVDVADPEGEFLSLLSVVLGGQSGRLFLDLRDRRSLAYSLGAFQTQGLHRGYFSCYIGTAPEKLAEAEAGLREHLERLRQDKVGADELDRAKRYLLGSRRIGRQRARSRASTMALHHCYGMGYDAELRLDANIQAASAEDLLRMAQRIIDFDREAVSVVGPQVREGSAGV